MALEHAMCAGISVPLDCWFGHYKKDTWPRTR